MKRPPSSIRASLLRVLAGLVVAGVLGTPRDATAQQTFPSFAAVPRTLYDVVANHVNDIVLKEDIVVAGVACARGPARAAYSGPPVFQALLQCRLAAPYTEVDFTIPVGSLVDLRGGTERGAGSRIIGVGKLGADMTYRGFSIGRDADIDMIGGKVTFKTSQATTLPEGLVLPPATQIVFPTTMRLPSFALPSPHTFGPVPLPEKTWVMVDLASGSMTLRGFGANTDFTLGSLPVKKDDYFVVWNGEDYETQPEKLRATSPRTSSWASPSSATTSFIASTARSGSSASPVTGSSSGSI
jgi:hypothetical protein